MSDNLKFDPNSGILSVPTDSGLLLGTPINSTIYMHSYEYRGADHIFVQSGETDDQILGAFVFRISADAVMENFDELVRQLIEAEFDFIVADEVSECDMAQFNKTADRFIGKISMVDLDSPWELTDGE